MTGLGQEPPTTLPIAPTPMMPIRVLMSPPLDADYVVLKAGMTCAAKRSSCSRITACGVPTG
jgi:hypothetical protein